jgi:hypothetical protein
VGTMTEMSTDSGIGQRAGDAPAVP